MKKVKVTFELSPAQREKLKRRAKKEGKSVAAVLREAVKDYVN